MNNTLNQRFKIYLLDNGVDEKEIDELINKIKERNMTIDQVLSLLAEKYKNEK